MYGHAVSFGASVGHSTVTGGGHRAKGIPNQDAAGAERAGPYVFGAVADGVGNTSVCPGSSGGTSAPTVSQVAVAAFSGTVKEFSGHHPEGRADLEWVLRVGMSAANIAVRHAKERDALPGAAATTLVGMAGSLVTGKVAIISLGDSGVIRCTPDGYDRWTAPAHTDDKGRLVKTLKGAMELRVPHVLTLPAATEWQRLVAHTDGLTDAHDKLRALGPDLALQDPGALLPAALRKPTPQEAADALTHMATDLTDEILLQGGMRPDSDDTSAFVLDMYPASFESGNTAW